METLELLLHPVRIRLVHAMAGGQTKTTAELADRLPDISRATVYRHVALLAEAGVLEVADERRVRGAVERQYRLRPGSTAISRDEAATMSLDQHREAFASALAVLAAEFDSYLESKEADPFRDAVGYTQHPLWLSRKELGRIQESLRDLLMAARQNRARPGRRPYLISPIVFPVVQEETDGATDL